MRGVIVAIGILIICAAVSYSFEDLTGFLIRDEKYTSIVLSPDPVCEGVPITLFIKPGINGAKRYFTVHRENGLRRGIKNWCSSAQGTCLSGDCTPSFKCYGYKSVNYRTNGLSEGTYYIRIYDYKLKDYITEPFEVLERTHQECKLLGLS